MIQLWPVQESMVRDVRQAYRDGHRSVLLVSPTGSGKTVMFAYMTHNHVQRNGRVLIIVHRQELMDQVCNTLDRFDQWHGRIASGEIPDLTAPVQVASIFTLIRRLHTMKWTPTLIIFDEAHHSEANTWRKITQHYAGISVRILGVTATPVRQSGEGLDGTFQHMVVGPYPQDLIDQGYLSSFRVFSPPLGATVEKKRSETEQAWLGRIERDDARPKIIGDAVKHYHSLTPGQPAVAFCLSVEDSRNVARQFRDQGYAAESVDGSMASDYRRDIIEDFRQRKLRIITSCDLISEGFDCPGIEVGIFLRPTQAVALAIQQLGRCLRISPGKKITTLLDHAGNVRTHGIICASEDGERVVFRKFEWSLSGMGGDAQSRKRSKTTRVCGQCWSEVPIYKKQCPPPCNFVFEVSSRKVPSKEGVLEEVTAEQAALMLLKKSQDDERTLQFLTKLGTQRGYKNPNGWARHVLHGIKNKRSRVSEVT